MHLARRALAIRSSEIRDLLRLAERPDVISLAGGLPDPASFPVPELAEAARAVLDDPGRTAAALQYSTTEGDPQLREWIAARHAAATGRATTPDQVLVTTGSQQGLDLLARVLADPGEIVVAEDPGYLGALQALRAAGLHLRGVPLDGEGLRTDVLEQRLRDGLRPRVVYTVPTFQNPTGTTMSVERRRHVAALADRYGVVIVEDAPYAALRFDGDTVEPVAAHSDRVVTLGTFSKTLAPGLRLGWIVGPEDVVAAATRAKQAVDLHTSGLAQQLALTVVARPGWLDAHIARVAARYGERARALRDALGHRLGDRLDTTTPQGGMFLWATPRPGVPAVAARELLTVALEHGTAFVPGDAFAVEEPTPAVASSLRLSFATAPTDRLAVAVDRLAAAIDQVGRTPIG